MAGPMCALWTKEIADKLINAAQGTKCPLSGGNKIRLTDGIARKMCERHKKKGVQVVGGRDIFGRYNAGNFKPYHACKDCKGPQSRKEIKIISAAEAKRIGSKL